MDFNQFRSEWTGKRIDWDRVYAFQCVDLILQYIYQCYGINSGVWGNAIDYWTKPSGPLLGKFYKVHSSDAQMGDIVIFKTYGRDDYQGDGHIGIATGGLNATEVEVLEQNGAGSSTGTGRDAITTRWIRRGRVAGLLRPIQVAKAPAPAPTPEPLAAASGDQVHLPGHVQTWAAYRPFSTYVKGSPDHIATLRPAEYGGLTYDIKGYHGGTVHIDTQMFGRVAIWVQNTDAVITHKQPPAPAPAPVPVSVPVVETPKPVPAPPAAPLPVPLARKYRLVTTLMYFAGAKDAQNHKNAVGTIDAGEYFVFSEDGDSFNLTKNNVKDENRWINIRDNVLPAPKPEPAPKPVPVIVVQPEPKPEPKPISDVAKPKPAPERPKLTALDFPYRRFFLDGRPVKYKAVNQQPFQITEFRTGKKAGLLQPEQSLMLVGEFEHEGRRYGRTAEAVKGNYYPGIPMGMVKVDFWANFLAELHRHVERTLDKIVK